ncbi:MAG: 30S ribosomal protein S27ae [Nanoarchaeota archaeon]
MAEKAEKKQEKKKGGLKIWKLYTKSGEGLTRKNPFCPKCGSGVFLAKHGNRLTCGKCRYTEFVKK